MVWVIPENLKSKRSQARFRREYMTITLVCKVNRNQLSHWFQERSGESRNVLVRPDISDLLKVAQPAAERNLPG